MIPISAALLRDGRRVTPLLVVDVREFEVPKVSQPAPR